MRTNVRVFDQAGEAWGVFFLGRAGIGPAPELKEGGSVHCYSADELLEQDDEERLKPDFEALEGQVMSRDELARHVNRILCKARTDTVRSFPVSELISRISQPWG